MVQLLSAPDSTKMGHYFSCTLYVTGMYQKLLTFVIEQYKTILTLKHKIAVSSVNKYRVSRQIVCLLESGECGAELVDGGVGDGLADSLVDLLPHVWWQLVHGTHSRARCTSAAGTPNIFVYKLRYKGDIGRNLCEE